jgi:tetratricopeptide (TPR) repeat protein
MYDIKPLEEEWKRYQRKKRRPWYILTAIAVLLIITLLAVLEYGKTDLLALFSKNSIEKTASLPSSLPTEKSLTEEKNQSNVPVSVPQANNTSVAVVANQNGSIEIVEELPIEEKSLQPQQPVVKEEPAVEEKPRKKMHLNIIETSSVSAYRDVAERFRQSHEIDDSLFLAKAYYRKGNYKKAEYWALQTNKINENIEESWLIFAKSKVKQGKRNEAIRVLTAYAKRSKSQQAKHLLEKIKQGRL